MKTHSGFSFLLLVASLVQLPSATAAVLRVANDEATQRIRVFDDLIGSAAFANATGIGIQVGTVTADIAGNRAYFIGNSAGAQALYGIDYTASTQALPQVLTTPLRITHLEWDSSGSPRLLGVAIDSADDSVEFVTIAAGTVTGLGMPAADCCLFRSGVSSFRSSDDSLYLVGRRSTDTQDHLFRFTMNPPTLAQAVAIPTDLSVNELAVAAGGQLLGLAYSTAAAATKVFTSDAAISLTLLGSGMSDCCFVLAGATALDTSLNRLTTLGPGIAGLQPNPPRLWSFDLVSGAITDGLIATNGAGLFFDGTAILGGDDAVFADGFE